MVLFINWLTSQLSGVTAEDLITFAPPSENGRETKPIREMDADEKAMYVVLAKIQEEKKSLQKEHDELHAKEGYDGSECLNFHDNIDKLDQKISLTKDILWRSIQMSLEDAPNHMQVMPDWQLVEVVEKHSNDMIKIISGGKFSLADLLTM